MPDKIVTSMYFMLISITLGLLTSRVVNELSLTIYYTFIIAYLILF